MLDNDFVVHFVIGSSIFATLFPLIVLYSGWNRLSAKQKANSKVSFEQLAVGLPIVYGILMGIAYNFLGVVPRKMKDSVYMRFVIAGTVPSLFINIALQYLGIHKQWLRMENPGLTNILVPAFYFVFFYTFGQWLRAQLLYGPTPSSSSSSSSAPSGPTKPSSAPGLSGTVVPAALAQNPPSS